MQLTYVVFHEFHGPLLKDASLRQIDVSRSYRLGSIGRPEEVVQARGAVAQAPAAV